MLAVEKGGQTQWMLADHQGTVRQVSDETGALLNQINYDSFGNITSQTNPSVTFRFGYTGREWDGETGQYYYRARYFDPRVGQFISQDPIGFAAGDANLYRYVGNSPTNFTDPSGKKKYKYKVEVEYDPTPIEVSPMHHARVIFIRSNRERIAYEAEPSIRGGRYAFLNSIGIEGASGFLIPSPSTFAQKDYAPAPPNLNQFIFEEEVCSLERERAAEMTIRRSFENLIPAKIFYSTFRRNSNSAAFHSLRTLLSNKYIFPKVDAPAWEINPFSGAVDPRAFGFMPIPERYPQRPTQGPGRPDRPIAF